MVGQGPYPELVGLMVLHGEVDALHAVEVDGVRLRHSPVVGSHHSAQVLEVAVEVAVREDKGRRRDLQECVEIDCCVFGSYLDGRIDHQLAAVRKARLAFHPARRPQVHHYA